LTGSVYGGLRAALLTQHGKEHIIALVLDLAPRCQVE
jgi:hypothetical protein